MIMRGLPSCRGRFGYASVLLGRIGQDFSGDAGEGLGEMVEEIGVPPTADESGDDLTAEAQDIGIVEAVVDRKSTRLNSSHVSISYAVFCLKKKKKKGTPTSGGTVATYYIHV